MIFSIILELLISEVSSSLNPFNIYILKKSHIIITEVSLKFI